MWHQESRKKQRAPCSSLSLKLELMVFLFGCLLILVSFAFSCLTASSGMTAKKTPHAPRTASPLFFNGLMRFFFRLTPGQCCPSARRRNETGSNTMDWAKVETCGTVHPVDFIHDSKEAADPATSRSHRVYSSLFSHTVHPLVAESVSVGILSVIK